MGKEVSYFSCLSVLADSGWSSLTFGAAFGGLLAFCIGGLVALADERGLSANFGLVKALPEALEFPFPGVPFGCCYSLDLLSDLRMPDCVPCLFTGCWRFAFDTAPVALLGSFFSTRWSEPCLGSFAGMLKHGL